MKSRPWVVGITGASGVCYGVRLTRFLLSAGRPVILIVSEAARLVIREELGISLRGFSSKEDFVDLIGGDGLDLLEIYSPRDFSAPVASGSYPTEGMVVIPCSAGTLGAIASGVSQHLIHRAADCTLKEGRPLILVPRETPLHAIHLENMLKLARLGVRIVPPIPGFYSGAQDLDGMVDFVIGKVLDQMNVPHALYARWTGLTAR